jgi:heme/copper-type cytochrome/quinol oxidase subunit 3
MMEEWLWGVFSLYLAGLVVQGFIMSISWLCQYEDSRMWGHKDPPQLEYSEVVVWSIFWPIADIIWVARFLAPGVKGLWERL